MGNVNLVAMGIATRNEEGGQCSCGCVCWLNNQSRTTVDD